MAKQVKYFSILLLILLGIGCHKKIVEHQSPNPVPPHIGPTVGNVEVNLDVPKNQNEFAINLYRQIASTQKDNIVLSPYSIYTAVAMAYLGARGQTEFQMSETMRYSLKQADFHLALKNNREKLLATNSEDQVLNIANSVWVQRKSAMLDTYYKDLKNFYGSGFEYVDFKNQSEKAREKINDWVSEKTNENIKNLIGEGALGPETKLVLANAIYFKGNWANPFKKQNSGKDDFYDSNGDPVKTTFMNMNGESFSYMENDLLQALMLPYSTGKYALTILLPKDKDAGVQKLEKYLTINNLFHWWSVMSDQKINLSIPKFKMEYGIDCSKILSAMGMTEAFSDQADFSGMNGRRDLKIDKVVHKASLEIDESGSEATAATAVIMMATSAVRPAKKVDFIANHPFLFVISDLETQTVLFIGKFAKPE